MKRILFAVVAAFVLTSSVNAAEISCHRGGYGVCLMGLLRGEIAKGAFRRVTVSGRTSAPRRPHSVQTKSGSTSDSARGPA